MISHFILVQNKIQTFKHLLSHRVNLAKYFKKLKRIVLWYLAWSKNGPKSKASYWNNEVIGGMFWIILLLVICSKSALVTAVWNLEIPPFCGTLTDVDRLKMVVSLIWPQRIYLGGGSFFKMLTGPNVSQHSLFYT